MLNLLGSLALALGLSGYVSPGVRELTPPAHRVLNSAFAEAPIAGTITDSASAPLAMLGARGFRDTASPRKPAPACPGTDVRRLRPSDHARSSLLRAPDHHSAATIAAETFPPRAPPDHN